MRVHAIVICLSVTLGGCATAGDLLDPIKNPHPILVAPGPQRQSTVPPLIEANYNVLLEATSVTGNTRTMRNVGTDNMRRYLGAGFALADTYCDEFFRLTDEAQRRRNFARSTTNDAGTVIATVLGLANAGENVVTGIAAGFGLLDSTFRNYDDAFVAGPDLAQTRSLVLAHQDSFKASTLAANAQLPGDYGSAQSVILRYANICSTLGIRSLLNANAAAGAQALQQQRATDADGTGDDRGTTANDDRRTETLIIRPTNTPSPAPVPTLLPGETPALPANRSSGQAN